MKSQRLLTLVVVLALTILGVGVASAQGPAPESVDQLTLPFEQTVSTPGTAFAVNNTGVGQSAVGVAGRTDQGYAGVVGYSATRFGVFGLSVSTGDAGVFGRNDGGGIGVLGRSASGIAVSAESTANFALRARSQHLPSIRAEGVNENAIWATTPASGKSAIWSEHIGSLPGEALTALAQTGTGVRAISNNGAAVNATSTNGNAVYARTSNADTIEAYADSADRAGLYARYEGESDGYGVYSTARRGVAVYARSRGGDGIVASSTRNGQSGIYAFFDGSSDDGNAGYFEGRVEVDGTLAKSAGSFKIDHPLDPANKYLQHSFVESPDMMNVYNGNVVTDGNGEAVVTLPDYFQALNRDYRYQLTPIGQFAQAIIAKEVEKNQFVIKTDKPGVKVSWQVTGVRQDAYARSHPIQVEVTKPVAEQGTFLHPEELGQPAASDVNWVRRPEVMREREAVKAGLGRP